MKKIRLKIKMFFYNLFFRKKTKKFKSPGISTNEIDCYSRIPKKPRRPQSKHPAKVRCYKRTIEHSNCYLAPPPQKPDFEIPNEQPGVEIKNDEKKPKTPSINTKEEDNS